jgi:hypothetical protein
MSQDKLEALSVLVGEWTTEATHPMVPGTVVHGTSVFEWLEGERFLIVRARSDHPDFPDSISVIGDTDGLQMHYFDSRGVFRIYELRMTGDTLEISRDAPQFSQRFSGVLEGDRLAGLWKLSRDDETWDDDLQISYTRAKS